MSLASRRAPLYAMALANFAVGTGALMIAGLVPEIAADLDVSEAAAGQLIAIYAVVYAVAAPLLSVLASRLPKRRILMIAAGGLAMTSLAAAFAPDFASLMVIRGATALFAALVTPVAASVATLIVPPGQIGSAIGVVFGGFAVSTVLGVPAGALIGGAFGWPAAFVMVAVLAGLAFIAIAAWLPGDMPATPTRLSELARTLRDTHALAAVGLTAIQLASAFVVFGYIAVIFQNGFGAQATEIFWLLMVFGLASVAGNHAGGVLTDRFGHDRVILYGLAALPLPLIGLYLAPLGFLASAVVMALWAFLGFIFTAPQQARLVRLHPDQRTMILALNASAIYVGNSVGTASGGLLLAISGTTWMPLAAGLTALAAFMFYLATRAIGAGQKVAS